MQGTLYQLLDKDGEFVGIVWTPTTPETSSFNTYTMEQIWHLFYNSFECDADEFVEWANDKYPLISLERVFVNELSPLS
jgi:hypothetical protein